MNYFFPTTTLNFDAIYSSMCIMPARYYCDNAIWFPKYFHTNVDLSEDVIVLYSSPVIWEIIDSDSENYPMLIAIDSSIVNKVLSNNEHAVQEKLANGISCVISNVPIVFNASDVLCGNVKVLFRTLEEKRSLVNRAKVGVSESKLPNALQSFNIDVANEMFPNDGIIFDSIKDEVFSNISSLGLVFDKRDFDEFERRDRLDGAIAGFHAGKWIKSFRDGYCLDCFRNGLDYESWKRTLPCEVSAVIDMLCGMIGFRWNFNRDEIVDFCTECWKRCFASSINSKTPRHEEWHNILRSIAQSHKDVTFNYPVSSISDCYMQAIACFIKTGKRYKMLADSIRDDHIKMPELALALHGALVGYSVFSRVLFERRSYEVESHEFSLSTPQIPRTADVDQSSWTTTDNQPFPQWASPILRFVKKLFPKLPKNYTTNKKRKLQDSLERLIRECKDQNELLSRLPNEEGWGTKTKVYKELCKEFRGHASVQGDLFSGNAVSESVNHITEQYDSGDVSQLITDKQFPEIVSGFVGEQLGLDRVTQNKICRDAKWFIDGYAPDGEYSRKDNQKDNSSTIRHFMNYLSDKMNKMKIQLSFQDKKQLESFLQERYK